MTRASGLGPRASALVVAIAACGGPARPAPAPAPRWDAGELVQLADGMHDVLTTMAAIVAQRAGDCPAIARDLRGLWGKSAPIFARARQLQQDPDAARALTAEMHKHDADSAGVADAIGEGLRPCAQDADVRSAIDAMPTLD